MRRTLLVSIAIALVAVSTAAYAQIATNSSTARDTTTFTATAGVSNNIPAGLTLASTASSHGAALETYLPTAPNVGDRIYIHAFVKNTNSSSTLVPLVEIINVTDASGKVVYQTSFPGGSEPIYLKTGVSWETTLFWDTSVPFDGITPQSGTYHVSVGINFEAEGSQPAFTLSTQSDVTLSS
jgi:hypothetical protein